MISTSNSLESKEARFNLRASSEDKAIIEKAAKIRGVKVSQFILKDAVKRAEKILEEEGLMMLNDDDRQVFVNAFLESHKQTPYLNNAINDYKNS